MQIKTVRWPDGQGRPAHLDGVGPYQKDLTIAPETFQRWVSKIRVQDDGAVIAPGGGDREKRIGYVNHRRRAMVDDKAVVLPQLSADEALEAVLLEWARNSNLCPLAEDGRCLLHDPAPVPPEPAPSPRRKKKDEE